MPDAVAYPPLTGVTGRRPHPASLVAIAQQAVPVDLFFQTNYSMINLIFLNSRNISGGW